MNAAGALHNLRGWQLSQQLRHQKNEELDRKIWKNRSKYFNLGYVKQSLVFKDFGDEILEEKTTYAKRGARWVEVKKEEKEVPATYVFNVFDAVQFFKGLGGYEKVSCGYTKAGYLPDELLSISPNRTEKTVRKYYFI